MQYDQPLQLTRGSIEVITGAMFSGKTEELLRRVSRAHLANIEAILFKPDIDTRYSVEDVVSHDKRSMKATPVQAAIDILGLSVDAQIVGIDEGQFFTRELVDVCIKLANGGKRVIIAGLDKNYKGQAFSPMPELMAAADYVTKLQGLCMECGAPATITLRKDKTQTNQVFLGERNEYLTVCRSCFFKNHPNIPIL